jgi:hypothetical protein
VTHADKQRVHRSHRLMRMRMRATHPKSMNTQYNKPAHVMTDDSVNSWCGRTARLSNPSRKRNTSASSSQLCVHAR